MTIGGAPSSSCPFAAQSTTHSIHSVVPATGHPRREELEKKFKESYGWTDWAVNTKWLADHKNRVIKGHAEDDSMIRRGCPEGSYHPIATFRSLPLDTRLVTDPDIAAAIYYQPRDDKNFRLSRSFRCMRDFFGGDNILTAPKHTHVKLKKFAKRFFRRDAVDIHADKVKALASQIFESWQSNPAGIVNNISADLVKFSAEIIMLSFFNAEEANQELAAAIETLTAATIEEIRNPFKWKDSSAIEAAKKVISDTVHRIIEQQDGDQLLVQMYAEKDKEGNQLFTIEEIQGMCKLLMLAGQDTLGHFLTYLVYILGKETDWQNQLRQELSTCKKDEPELLKLAIDEALRLFPSVYDVSREANQDLIINDEHFVPKGWGLDIMTLRANQDENRWGADALSFNPKRATPASGKDQYAFGLGPHRCLGEHFANMVIRGFLTIFLSKYTWKTLNEEEVGFRAKLTLRMAEEINIQLTPAVASLSDKTIQPMQHSL